MPAVQVYQATNEVTEKLAFFGANLEELQAVALEAISARNEATPLHPQNAPGMYSYMAGVAALRMIFVQKDGWKSVRPKGVEAVANSRTETLILFQNVDFACGKHEPSPLSAKGEGVTAIVDNPTGFLWDYMEHESNDGENRHTWFFCVSVNGDEVRAELSRPKFVENGNFGTFAERIFIIQDTDWSQADDKSGKESDDDFDIPVSKKG